MIPESVVAPAPPMIDPDTLPPPPTNWPALLSLMFSNADQGVPLTVPEFRPEIFQTRFAPVSVSAVLELPMKLLMLVNPPAPPPLTKVAEAVETLTVTAPALPA